MKHKKIKFIAFTVALISLLASCGESETSSKEVNSTQSETENASSNASSNESKVNSEEISEVVSQSGNVMDDVILKSANEETDGKLDVYIDSYQGKSPVVTISNPDDSTIRFVEIKAFYKNESIKEVTLPDTVTEIRSDCFAFCKNLEKVYLGTEITEIHDHAFFRCSNLKQVILGDKLEKIEEYAFSACTSLEEIIIPPSCIEIGNISFAMVAENFKIKGEKGSYAEEYAKANEIPFEEYNFN